MVKSLKAGNDAFNHNRKKQLFSSTCLLWFEDTSSLTVFSWWLCKFVCRCVGRVLWVSVYVLMTTLCLPQLTHPYNWSCTYMHSSLLLCFHCMQSILPPLHAMCFVYDTGVWWQSALLPFGNSICHFWVVTKVARSTVAVRYLTTTLLNPSHLHLEWMPYCQCGSILLGQIPSEHLCLLFYSTHTEYNNHDGKRETH